MWKCFFSTCWSLHWFCETLCLTVLSKEFQNTIFEECNFVLYNFNGTKVLILLALVKILFNYFNFTRNLFCLFPRQLGLACFLVAFLFSVKFTVRQVDHKTVINFSFPVFTRWKINLRHSNPSVRCRIFLNLYRCALTRIDLFYLNFFSKLVECYMQPNVQFWMSSVTEIPTSAGLWMLWRQRRAG